MAFFKEKYMLFYYIFCPHVHVSFIDLAVDWTEFGGGDPNGRFNCSGAAWFRQRTTCSQDRKEFCWERSVSYNPMYVIINIYAEKL